MKRITQRVRENFLSQGADGKRHFGAAPFSGLAYQVGADQVLKKIIEIADGVTAGPSTDWLALPKDGIRVDRASLKLVEDYGPQLFEDRPFTGIAYSFTRNGICFAEIAYISGHATEESEREWYETGEPKTLVDGGKYTSWFPDGRLQRKGINGEVLLNLNTQDDGRLASLVLRDTSLLDLETLRALTPTDEFMMVGEAIDTKLLNTLRDHTGIGAVRKLRLVNTGVDRQAVDVLTSFKNLDEIWLDGNPGLGTDEARQIELHRPGCVVHTAST